MADDEDRQPPQAYDTVAPAGVGTTTSNQVSPGTMQEILDTGDQNLIAQAFDQIEEGGDYDALTRYLESLPDLPPPAQASSPAGVGSRASHSPPFQSPQTTPGSSPDTPPSRGSATLTPTPRTARGGRTAAGAGGDGNGGGRRGPRTRGGGRGGGGGGGRGGAGAGGGRGGAGAGGGGGGGRGGAGADDFSPLHLPPPLPDRLEVLADNLVPCVKPIYNDVYACCYKIKNNWPKDVKLRM